MKRNIGIVLVVLMAVIRVSAETTLTSDYVVVDFCGANDPYHKAATRLAELRHGEIVPADPEHLDLLLEILRNKPPRMVAFVVRPDQFDENLARALLELATKIDDDPFVDFAYGFITGDSPESAVSLVEQALTAEKRRRKPELAVVAVGEKVITKSGVTSQRFPLRKMSLPQLWGQLAGGENFPGDERDTSFIKTLMPQLQNKSIVIFAGHGYPSEVVGGPNWKDLDGTHLTGSVVLNIACYTGVTGTWYEDDWSTGRIRKRTVPTSESFCLNVIKSGVAAYVAYACARPAGPELFSDVGALAGEGMSVGEVRCRDNNRIILAYLAQGFDKLNAPHVEEGQVLKPRKNIVKDLLLDMSTGGVVFGDPAFQPFPAKTGEAPLEVMSQRKGDELTVTMQVASQHLFFECGEQLDTWGDAQAPAMRLMTRVPLGQAYVSDVQLKELKVGAKAQPNRIAWGVEEDRGERFLHVKVVFPQPNSGLASAKAVIEAKLTNESAKARRSSIAASETP
jgi:hypothetical protein